MPKKKDSPSTASAAADVELLAWAKSHGARTPAFKVGSDEGGERGIVAATATHARAEIVAIPRRLIITDADARARSEAVRRACQAAPLLPEHQLMLFLVIDRYQLDSGNQHSEGASASIDDVPSFGPWYAALPADFGTLPMFWPAADAAEQHEARNPCCRAL